MAETIYAPVNGMVTLGLHLVEDGSGVTGQSPTVEIRRLSDGFYFDHDATAAPYFVDSGGTAEGTLTAKPWLPGFYTLDWDHSTADPDNDTDYLVIYRNDDPDYGVEVVETYCFQITAEIGAYLEFICKILKNNSIVEILSESQVLHTWFDSDGTTPILKHKLTKSPTFERREIEP